MKDLPRLSQSDEKELERFVWNPKPSNDQIAIMNHLRGVGKDMAEFMLRHVPPSADRSAAIRSLRLAIMQANAAVTHDWVEKEVAP